MRRLSIAAAVSLVMFGGVMNAQDGAPRRTILIFVDDLHIDFATTPALRSQLRQAVDVLIAAGRAVELATATPDGRRMQPTRDGGGARGNDSPRRPAAPCGEPRLPQGTDFSAELERRAVAAEAALVQRSAVPHRTPCFTSARFLRHRPGWRSPSKLRRRATSSPRLGACCRRNAGRWRSPGFAAWSSCPAERLAEVMTVDRVPASLTLTFTSIPTKAPGGPE